MKPVTADAMQSRALGSMWLFPRPPFMNFCRVALGDRPLARAVEREAGGFGLDPVGDDVDRLVPGDGHVPPLRLSSGVREPVGAVEREAHVVALHAEQALVHLGLSWSPAMATTLPAAHADLHVAARAAEAAGRLVPGHAAPACDLRSRRGRLASRDALRAAAAVAAAHGASLEEVSTVHGQILRASGGGACVGHVFARRLREVVEHQVHERVTRGVPECPRQRSLRRGKSSASSATGRRAALELAEGDPREGARGARRAGLAGRSRPR
jgi:hypothetical protein